LRGSSATIAPSDSPSARSGLLEVAVESEGERPACAGQIADLLEHAHPASERVHLHLSVPPGRPCSSASQPSRARLSRAGRPAVAGSRRSRARSRSPHRRSRAGAPPVGRTGSTRFGPTCSEMPGRSIWCASSATPLASRRPGATRSPRTGAACSARATAGAARARTRPDSPPGAPARPSGRPRVLRHEDDVEGWTIVDQDLAVAIVDDAACGRHTYEADAVALRDGAHFGAALHLEVPESAADQREGERNDGDRDRHAPLHLGRHLARDDVHLGEGHVTSGGACRFSQRTQANTMGEASAAMPASSRP
jgi:hypothetical protein